MHLSHFCAICLIIDQACLHIKAFFPTPHINPSCVNTVNESAVSRCHGHKIIQYQAGFHSPRKYNIKTTLTFVASLLVKTQAVSQYKYHLSRYREPHWLDDRLIFITGIPTLTAWHLYIETFPRTFWVNRAWYIEISIWFCLSKRV